ncbi:MAG: cupin domain-containing protein [Bacteroidaceae bacterium]|nr:cupin domain-containing protein [Bacteroidaceae bacterium]
MRLDFETMPFEDFPNFKGGEKTMRAQMFNDGKVKILHGILEPGASIGEHIHDFDAEVMFIIEGNGTIIDDGVASPIWAGQCTYCPKDHFHSLVNTGLEDLEFYAVVPRLE